MCWNYGSRFIFCIILCSCFYTIYSKDCIFCIGLPWHLCHKSIDLICVCLVLKSLFNYIQWYSYPFDSNTLYLFLQIKIKFPNLPYFIFLHNVGLQPPQELQGIIWNWPAYGEGRNRPKRKTRSFQIGRWQFNKQADLVRRLVLGSHKMDSFP